MTNDEHRSTRREQVDESSLVSASNNEGSTGAVPLVDGRPTRREGERTRTRVNLPDALTASRGVVGISGVIPGGFR